MICVQKIQHIETSILRYGIQNKFCFYPRFYEVNPFYPRQKNQRIETVKQLTKSKLQPLKKA